MVNIVGLILFVAIIVALTIIFLKYKKGMTVSEETPLTMQDLLGVSSIRNGILTLGDGRHCRIIQVDSLNYKMLSGDEALRVESIFGSMLASFNFPFQFYTQTRLIDLSSVIDALDEDIKAAPDSLKNKGMQLRNYLRDVRPIMVRFSYIVVVCKNENYTEARKELDHRQRLAVEGISRLGLLSKVLNDQEISDLLYAIYNTKTRALVAPLRNALDGSLYVKGDSDSAEAV
jgi:hypothetical protein